MVPLHSAGLLGRVKLNPDNALLSGLSFTGCSWKPCWCVELETFVHLGLFESCFNLCYHIFVSLVLFGKGRGELNLTGFVLG